MKIRNEAHYAERVIRCFAERPRNVADLFRASVARAPDAVAIVDGAARITYRELAERVARLGAGLEARGVRRGERVAMLLHNRAEALEVMLACASIGAVLVPMNVRQRAPETQFILAHSGAAVLVFEASLAEHLPHPNENPELRLRVAVGDGAADALPIAACYADPPPAETPLEPAEEAPACILYTSGTTGRPKGAILTHLAVVHSCLHQREALGLGAGECAILAAPVSHVTGLIVVSLATMLVAGRLVIMSAFKAAKFLELAERERLTFTVMVPAMYNLCLLDASFPSRDLACWRVAGFGGAPMPEATIAQLAQVLPSLQLANIYGATESAGPAVIMPLGQALAHRDAVGRALPCTDILIMDEDGRQVPPGESGEVWIAGPNVAPGYWQDAEATRGNFVQGYWRSGDIGAMDADGYVSVFDRKKDMINRGGFKVYSVEVENVLSHMPGVLEAAVVGRPCPVLGERVHAFICATAPDVTAEAVRAFCAERLSNYKVPDYVDVSSEPLPRNANGKILKAALRARIVVAG